jgi:hypothetical protein
MRVQPRQYRAARPKLTPAGTTFNESERRTIDSVGKPPITIRCDCGETKDVPYGERWRCERCGRSWNTRQIPAEEYEGLLRRVRRHQLEALGLAAVIAAVLVPLITVVSSGFILLVPMVMAVWLFVFLPFWRRRYRRTAQAAPRWQLHPE